MLRAWVLGAMVLGAGAASAQVPAPLTLAALEARAIERHPAVREAAARLDEARALASQAGAWENPSLGGGASELRWRESPSGTWGAFVEQTFSLGGKRSADRDAAALAAAVREAELDLARLRVRVNVRTAYLEVAGAAERLSVLERLTATAEETVVIAKQLVNVGLADRPDVLEAEAEVARHRAAVVAARAHQSAAWRRLAASVADLSLTPHAVTVPDGVPVLDRQRSLDDILSTSPDLRSADAAVARERAGVTVESRRTFPDLTMRGAASWNREQFSSRAVAKGWEFGVEAGFTLPLFNRNRHGVLAARSAVTASEAAAARMRLDIEYRFVSVFEEYEAARVLAETLKTEVLPKLEEAHRLHLEGYQRMATPYPQVLMAQRMLATTTGEYVEALEQARLAAARVQGLLVDGGER
jgi:cobalt-zinc-cadmium efflux system outer membrane protein